MAVYRLQVLEVASEVTFASTASDPSTITTWGDYRLPAEDIVLNFSQERIPDVAVQARQNVRGLSHIGLRTATLEFTTNWPGHNTDPGTGSLTERWPVTLLGYALGGKRTAGAGSTISGTASGVQSVSLASAAGFSAGDVCAIGTKGDGRGDGQVLAIATVSATDGTLSLLTDAPAAPTTAGDTVSRLALVFWDETATLKTVRFRAEHAGTGEQFLAHGCQLSGIKITWPMDGGLPKARWTYQCAYWNRQAFTFPPSSTMESAFATPPAAGSLYLQDSGTTTRVTKTPASVELDFDLGLEPTIGPGGVATFQNITGWVRTRFSPRIALQIPFETARETAWDVANQSYTYEHMLWCSNATGGRRTGFYAPRLFYEGTRPSVPVAVNEQTYINVMFRATEGATTTTELTRSALRLFAG